MEKFIKGKKIRKSKEKEFIILFGLNIYDKSFIKKQFKLKEENYIFIGSDFFIQTNEAFLKKSKELVNKTLKLKVYNDLTNEILKESKSNIFESKLEADEISNKLLDFSLQKEFDIVYEINGSDINWFYSYVLPKIKDNYKISILYYAAEDEKLLSFYFEKGKKNGFFYSIDEILEISKKSEENFLNLMSNEEFDFYVLNPEKVFEKKKENIFLGNYKSLSFLPNLRNFIEKSEKKGGKDFYLDNYDYYFCYHIDLTILLCIVIIFIFFTIFTPKNNFIF